MNSETMFTYSGSDHPIAKYKMSFKHGVMEYDGS